jgi:hypothetical protein
VLGIQLGTPRGRYDEHNSKFPSVMKPRFNWTSRRKPNFRRLMLASFVTLRRRTPDKLLVDMSLFTSSNVEPAHNTTKNFAPTYDEVVNLTGLL